MRKLLYIVGLALMVATVSAGPRKAKGPTPADVRKAEFLYNSAISASLNDSADIYFDLMRQAYSIDSTDMILTGEYGMLLSFLGRYVSNDTLESQGLAMARKAFIANPANLEYGRRYIGFLGKLQQDSLAQEAVRMMRVYDPLNEELLQMAIDVIKPKYFVLDSTQIDRTLSLIDTLEMAHGVSAATVRERASIYLLLEDTTKVKELTGAYFADNRHDRDARMLWMRILSIYEDTDSLIALGSELYEASPTDLENVMLLAEGHLAKGDTTRYLNLLEETMLNESLPPEVVPQLVVTFAKEVMSKEGMEERANPMITRTYAALVKAHPYDDQLMQDYIGWLNYIGEPASASIMDDYLSLHPSDINLWMALIDKYLREDTAKAADAITRAERYFPNMATLAVLKAQTLLRSEPLDTVGALRELARADSLGGDTIDVNIRSMIKGAQGDLLIAQGDTLAGLNNYRAALQLKPDNYMLANNLAYFLALQETDLPEARTLIERCLRNIPDDPMWLDTYAWVLYKQGEYSRAAKTIEKAITGLAQEDTIAAEQAKDTYHHAGDIYFKLGDTAQAVKNWKRALVYAPEDAVLRRKIKAKNINP